MKEIEWLLKDTEINEITNNYEWDWVWLKLADNGLTSPTDAFNKFLHCRFEYFDYDCPKCGLVDKHYELSFECWKCKECGNKFTVTSCTFIDNTKIEYYKWWRFCYLLGDLKITNSHVIAHDLQLTQKTAWWMLDSVRTARKETTEKKFVNGQEILVFNHSFEILELLLKRKDQPTLKFKQNIP